MIPRYPDGVRETRRPGRPRVAEPRSTVSTWLPASVHDQLIQVAQAREMPVSALVRHLIILRLPRE